MKTLTKDIIFNSDDLTRNLAGKSVRGGMINIVTQAIELVLRIAGITVLARLLTPNDYGLVGMVMVIVGFAEMFKDAGLSTATVQRDHISHEQISTLFWINVLISAFLGLCVLAASPLVAVFYGRPELTAVTAAFSISFIISGLMIQHKALLNRHMQFGKLATIKIASQIIALILTIILALLGWRYWALVVNAITLALAETLLTFFFCPWLPSRMKKDTGIRSMLKFGGDVTGFNFINYFARNADNILIGKFIGSNALGLYSRAYQLFMMPISQIRGPMTTVAMPVLSALKAQPQRYIKYYQRLLEIMVSLTLPLTLYCAIEADFLIALLLGPQWLGAVPVFRILAIIGVVQAVAGTPGLVMLSFGFSRRYLYLGIVSSLVYITSFVVGLPFGIKGVAASYVIANYVLLVPSLFIGFHKTPVTVSLFFSTITPPLFIGFVAAGLAMLVKNAVSEELFLGNLLLFVVFVGAYFGGSCCRRSFRKTMGMFSASILNR